MPVRSLSSSVLRWPDGATVDAAVRRWADSVVERHRDVVGVGYFGSYARGDSGVGSDVDLIILVKDADQPFERRATRFDTTDLPVPAELVVYTTDEWAKLTSGPGFARTVAGEVIWIGGDEQYRGQPPNR
ncbi:MAG: nucleotidyltransferase domain-containing protein [Actinobacteria bacterium]|nr:nucleotidyltransferase domain-containing protein [Actinomycetota bacterium]